MSMAHHLWNDYWNIETIFDEPVTNVRLVDVSAPTPKSIEDLVKLDWVEQLKKKQSELKEETVIVPYHNNTEWDALYENGKAIMFPGPNIQLKYVTQSGSRIDLGVSQSSYPYMAALSDEKVIEAHKDAEIDLPRPNLGSVCFGITTDEKIVLTRRGKRTNVYPGRLHGTGGNPEYTSLNLVDHMRGEFEEEILVKPQEVGQIYFGGIVSDLNHYKNKPDIVSWANLKVSSREIGDRVNARMYHPPDAIGIWLVDN